EDIIIGSGIMGRSHADLYPIVGMFINALPTRNRPMPGKTCRDFLMEVKQHSIDAFANQDVQFEDLVDSLQLPRDPSRNPLFDVSIVVQNFRTAGDQMASATVAPFPIANKTAKFDLTLYVYENAEEFSFSMEYTTSLFKQETIQRLFLHFQAVLQAMSSNPGITLGEMDIVPQEEKRRLLYDFNDTAADYPTDKTIHQLFEQQVEKTPDAVALVGRTITTGDTGNGKPAVDKQHPDDRPGMRRLTYKDVNTQADALARHLLFRGTEPVTIAAVMVERSVELIIGILAVLKAGGAYLPIAVDYPAERIRYMLEDSKTGLLLTHRQGDQQETPLNKDINYDKDIVYIEDILYPKTKQDTTHRTSRGTLHPASQGTPHPARQGSDIAYVIYTSGSTGRPKGVAVEHRGIANLNTVFSNQFQIGTGDAVIQFAAISFDASVWEIFMALLNGAGLHVLSTDTINDSKLFLDYLETNKITVATLPPQYAGTLAINRLGGLRILITAGSSPSPDFIKKCAGLFRYINAYGPTEDTICSSFLELTGTSGINSASIGKPIANKQVVIVDGQMNLQPIGVPGELCVSGAGIARGYLNRPELTADQFVAFDAAEPGDHTALSSPSTLRLYKTGDLARWLPDGNIEFLGRIDFQVKIRGYRIEPGEIEARLTARQDIKEAAVAVRGEGNDKKIVAYLVSVDAGRELPMRHVGEYLSKHLPAYMIPSGFVQMESLPLTPSGKIDDKALPGDIYDQTEETYVPPADDVEKILADILADLLGREKVSVHDNFFTSGGDSIKAMQVAGRLQSHRLTMSMKDFFQYPTIRTVRPHIKTAVREISQEPVSGDVPLTPIQHWFFQTGGASKSHFNQAIMLHRPEGFDPGILETVFRHIITHHDALRMVYPATLPCQDQKEPAVRQFNRPLPAAESDDNRSLFHLEVRHLQDATDSAAIIEQKSTEIQENMDLQNGPPVRLGLFKTDSGDHLLVAVHHLVVDGVSWRVLVEDMAAAYTQCLEQKDIRLPNKTDSYLTWATQLEQYAKSPQLLKETAYWKQVEDTDVPRLPRDSEIAGEHKTISFTDSRRFLLDEATTTDLLTRANRAYGTEINHLLLTALSLAIKDWCGISRISVNLEGHGREDILPDLDIRRTIGWFTSQFPVILDTGAPLHSDAGSHPDAELSLHIRHIKETLRNIPNKGIGYGILEYLTSQFTRPHPSEPPTHENSGVKQDGHNGDTELNRPIQAEIFFNYLGQFDGMTGQNNTAFSFSPFKSGRAISPQREWLQALDINGMISDGQLSLSVTYNAKEYKKSSIETLTECYKKRLTGIIRHCLSRKQVQPTPSDLDYPGLTIGQLDHVQHQAEALPMENRQIENLYPLAPMQAGMLFHYLAAPGSGAYFEQAVLTLKGHLDTDGLRDSFQYLLDRYDIFRTLFFHEGIEQPVQVVFREGTIDMGYEDISHMPQDEKEAYIIEKKTKDKQRGFDLSKEFPMRVLLFKTAGEEEDRGTYRMIWSHHHITMDGWCLGLLFKDIMSSYHARHADGVARHADGEIRQIKPVHSYGDYLRWLNGRDKTSGLEYWRNYLADYDQQIAVAGCLKPPGAEDNGEYQVEEHHCRLNLQLTSALQEIAAANRATLNTVLQVAWGLLLQRYNNCSDVVFGSVVSGRPPEIPGIEEMVGLFINTVPIRIRTDAPADIKEPQQTTSNGRESAVSPAPSGIMSFLQIIEQVQADALAARDFEYIPLPDIQAFTSLNRELIHHIMVFENYPLQDTIKATDAQLKPEFEIVKFEALEQTGFDFNLLIVPGDSLLANFNYNSLAYNPDAVARIGGHLKHLLLQIAAGAGTDIRKLDILPPDERELLVQDFNTPWPTTDTGVPYPAGKTIHQMFQEQAFKSPDGIAVVGSTLRMEPGPRAVLPAAAESASHPPADTSPPNDTQGEVHEEPRLDMAGTADGKLDVLYGNLTYKQLNEKANQLAHLLKEKGVSTGTMVALMVERSTVMIISILAVLKAGAAYLPVDPNYPETRINAMLSDCKPALILQNRTTVDNAKDSKTMDTLGIETIDVTAPHIYSDHYPVQNPTDTTSPADLLYIIYTSGSTGKPKGVMLEHRNLVNLMFFQKHYTSIDFSRVLQFTTVSFDVSFQEIFGTLLSGGSLYLIDDETRQNVPQLFRIVEDHHICTLFLPAAFLMFIFNQPEYIESLPAGVKHIVTAGEQPVVNDAFRNYLQRQNVRFHNHYGPSETHVATVLTIEPDGPIPHIPPIGKPVLNTPVYIVDRDMNLQPHGVPGELLIGGVQVGRGYLGREEETNRNYVPDPFAATAFTGTDSLPAPSAAIAFTGSLSPEPSTTVEANRRLYRTGDLTRWLEDGTIQFLGRIDRQVKIRGFRVELAEIEHHLLNCKEVTEAVVEAIDPGDGHNALYAYIVPAPDITNADASLPPLLGEYLNARLPHYMVPAGFIFLDEFPLTPSRKIDRKKLPKPGPAKASENRTAPRQEIERILAAIWAEVLNIPESSIGIDDDFFQLGGHSLKATILISKIHKKLDVKLSIARVFQNPSIRALVQLIRQAVPGKTGFVELENTEKKEYYPISYNQHRIYILQQIDTSGTSFNMPLRMQLNRKTDESVVEKAMKALMKRHESLRTGFKTANHKTVQYIAAEPALPFQFHDLSSAAESSDLRSDVEEIFNSLTAVPFDLASLPLFRSALVKLGPSQYEIMFNIHHIVSDGWSTSLLRKDFTSLYEYYASNETGKQLPPGSLFSYIDFTLWHNKQWKSRDDQDSLSSAALAWKEILGDGVPDIRLPADFSEGIDSPPGAAYGYRIPLPLMKQLLKLAEKSGTSMFILLFSVFMILLARVSRQEDVGCSVIVAGRQHDSVQDIIGLFVNSVLFRADIQQEQSFEHFLDRMNTTLMTGFQYQDYPMELVFEELNMRYPDVKVSYNMLNILDTAGTDIPISFETGHTKGLQDVKFDLEPYVSQYRDGIALNWMYREAMFKPTTIEFIASQYTNMLEFFSGAPERSIKEFSAETKKKKKSLFKKKK
ncbi:MAG: amino acid adenylation domain-containing protein, partial [bacterium]|nr:amino acid adenylation domain-containing protein [bacterium]